jgi:hypothetical protein
MRSLRSLVALAVAVGLAAGCGSTAPPGASSTPSGRVASTSTTAPSASSAATQLAAFFAAAQHADSQLNRAAALINGDITATLMRFTPAAIAAVRGIDLVPVAAALPSGLPAEMLREVLVVYGDLASRTDALNGVKMYGSPGRQLPIGSPQAQSVLRGLRNAAPAAARFNSDLAAARALARQTPRVTVAAPDSRAALELALRLQSISLRNSCDEEFGGYAPASLETIVWQPGTGQHSRHYQGLVGGIGFTADYTVQHGWTINIHAC